MTVLYTWPCRTRVQVVEFSNDTITFRPGQDPVRAVRKHCGERGCPEKVCVVMYVSVQYHFMIL